MLGFVALVSIGLLPAFTISSDQAPCIEKCTCNLLDANATFDMDCAGGDFEDQRKLQSDVDKLIVFLDGSLHLRSLTLSNVPLMTVPTSVCRLTALETLSITSTIMERLPDHCFDNSSRLEQLQLDNNRLTEIQDGIFDRLDRILSINLSCNRIESIGLHVFGNLSNMPKLNQVSITSNNMTYLDAWPIMRAVSNSQSTRFVVQADSSLRSPNFTSQLGWKYDCVMKSPPLELWLRSNNIRRFSELLHPWGIDSQTTLLCFRMHHEYVLILDQNNYVCDCVDFYIYANIEYYRTADFMDGTFCKSPQSLYGESCFSVPLNALTCDFNENCPVNCSCLKRPANLTLHVKCSDVDTAPVELPPLPHKYKYHVDLSNNWDLQRLDNRSYLAEVAVLDVTHSRIQVVDIGVWERFASMKLVNLHGNALMVLPEAVLRVNLSESEVLLSLGGNPWSCDCSTQWMSGWLNSNADRLANIDDILCGAQSRYNGRSVRRMTPAELCASPVDLTLVVSMTLSTVLIAVLVFVAVFHRMRLFFHVRWKFHPFDRDDCVGEDMDYDVFLCCSGEDHDQLAMPLLGILRSHNYHVCYHIVDFLPGETIANSIVASITRSKRVLCVVTESFIRSSYCMYEFDQALHHAMFIKRHRRLILLIVSDDPTQLLKDDDSSVASLRQYTRQQTYIDYNKDRKWIDKLLYAMPVTGSLEATTDEPLLDDPSEGTLRQ